MLHPDRRSRTPYNPTAIDCTPRACQRWHHCGVRRTYNVPYEISYATAEKSRSTTETTDDPHNTNPTVHKQPQTRRAKSVPSVPPSTVATSSPTPPPYQLQPPAAPSLNVAAAVSPYDAPAPPKRVVVLPVDRLLLLCFPISLAFSRSFARVRYFISFSTNYLKLITTMEIDL